MSKSHEVPFIKNINERGKKESPIFAESSVSVINEKDHL